MAGNILYTVRDILKVKLNPDTLFPSTVFRSGVGFVGDNYIDCSANPYDLKPAADIIIKAACTLKEALPAGKPLVILMGEKHTVSSHKELLHLVAARLFMAGQDFTVNFELPHDTWIKVARNNLFPSLPETFTNPEHYDLDGRISLSAIMGFCSHPTAPVSNNNLSRFCYDNGIKAVFNDAARMYKKGEDVSLDLTDDFTSSVALECLEEKFSKNSLISALGSDGLAIRNACMARYAVNFARSHNIPLLLQKTGTSHVFGSLQDKADYHRSLCVEYRKAGAAVLPVFVSSREDGWGINRLPEDSYVELHDAVVIDGLADDQFFAGQEALEQSFITERLHKETGDEIRCYDVTASRREYMGNLIRHAMKVKIENR